MGTGAGEGATGQDTGTAWVTRSTDCPEAPAQAHPLDAVARATPCACSAQRTRAEAAEAERDRLVAGIEALVRDAAEFYSPALRVFAVPADRLRALLDDRGDETASAARSGCASCLRCDPPPKTASGLPVSRMYLCATCGNKRCPAATDCQRWECSGSNEPGQMSVPRDRGNRASEETR